MTICSTISPGVRFRSRPSFAVRQKSHLRGQPDCDEKQMVSRFSVGIKTASTGRPSDVFIRKRRVPSSETYFDSTVTVAGDAIASSFSRNDFGRSVISSNERNRLWYIPLKI